MLKKHRLCQQFFLEKSNTKPHKSREADNSFFLIFRLREVFNAK